MRLNLQGRFCTKDDVLPQRGCRLKKLALLTFIFLRACYPAACSYLAWVVLLWFVSSHAICFFPFLKMTWALHL